MNDTTTFHNDTVWKKKPERVRIDASMYYCRTLRWASPRAVRNGSFRLPRTTFTSTKVAAEIHTTYAHKLGENGQTTKRAHG